MTSILKVDTLQDSGGNTMLSSDGAGTFTSSLPAPSSLSTASGSAPSYSARAWVNWDGASGAGTSIRGSGNVSSITYNGTGLYTVNLTNALSDVNGTAVGGGSASTSGSDNRLVCTTITSTTTIDVRTTNASAGTPVDMSVIYVTVFR